MQTISSALATQVEAGAQYVKPKVVAEWQNSRQITNAVGFSSSDNYDKATLSMKPIIYSKLNEKKYSDVVIADGPMSYWKLDEPSGTTAVDTMGYCNGVYTNGVLLNQTSTLDASGASASFDGSNDYIELGVNYLTGAGRNFIVGGYYSPQKFSMEAWINLNTYGTGNSGPIFSLPSYYSWAVWGDGTLRFINNQGWTATTASTIPLSTWTHVAAVFDGISMVLYINGLSAGVYRFTPLQKAFDMGIQGFGDAQIGAYGPNTGDMYNGIIDDVAYYQYDLSATQIWEHYAAGVGIAADISGTGTLGTYNGIPVVGRVQSPLNIITPVYETSGSASGVAVSSLKWYHTIGGQKNRILVVGISMEQATSAQTVSSVTIDGISLTRNAATAVSATVSSVLEQTEFWYCLDANLPPAGTYPVQVTFASSTGSAVCGSVSLYNVAQVPAEAIATSFSNASATTNSLSVTPVNPSSMIIDIVGGGVGATTYTATGSNTKRVDATSANSSMSMSTLSVPANVAANAMSFTASVSQDKWAHSAMVLTAAQKVYDTAVTFDGTNDYVAFVPNADPLNNFQFEVWCFLGAHPGNGIRTSVVNKSSGVTNATTQYGLDFVGTGASTTNLAGYVCCGANRYEVTSTANVTLAQWYHCVVTLIGGTVNFYLNGTAQGTPAVTSGTINVGGGLSLGRQGSNSAQYLNGRIANFSFYSVLPTFATNSLLALLRNQSGRTPAYYDIGFATPDEIVNGRADNNHTWAQTEAVDANGQVGTYNGKFILSEPETEDKTYQYEYGWQTSVISDASGTLAIAGIVAVTFDQINCDSIVLTFPSNYGRTKKFSLFYINSSNVLTGINTYELEANQTSMEVSFSSRTAVKGFVFEPFTTWNPFDRARISEIIPMIREDISADVVTMTVNKVKENFDSTVPFGATGANNLSLVLEDTALKYNPKNVSSPVYGWLDVDTPLDISLGWLNTGGSLGLSLPGTSGNYATTPDKSHFDIVADIELIGQVAMADWTPTIAQTIVSKWLTAGNQKSYALQIASTGAIRLAFSADGINTIVKDSSVATGLVDGSTKWVRATLDVDNGASGYDVKFYVGDDGVNWTQLGTTVTTATATSIFSSSAEIDIGSTDIGTANFLVGKVYRVKIIRGLLGTTACDVDFINDVANASATTFFDSANTWTLKGTAALISGGTEYVKQGRYYADTWNADTTAQTSTTQARDASKFLQEVSTDNGVVLYNTTASKAIASMAKTGKILDNQIDIDYAYSERVLRDSPFMFHRWNTSTFDAPAVDLATTSNFAYMQSIRTFDKFPSDELTLEIWNSSSNNQLGGARPTLIASGSSTVDGTSFSAAGTTSGGSFYVMVIANTHASSAPSPTSVTTTGITWTLGSTELATGSLSRVSVYYGVATATSSLGATVVFPTTTTSFHYSLTRLDHADQTGANGVNAITNFVVGTTTATSIALSGAAANGEDIQMIAAFEGQNATGLTPEAGWTELSETSQATPSGDLAVAWTKTTDTTPSYSSVTSGIWAAIAFTIVTNKQPLFNYGTFSSLDEFSLDILSSGEILVTKVGNTFTTSGAALMDDKWHHLAITFTTSTGTVNVFKDGKNIGSGSLNTTPIVTNGFVAVGNKMKTWGSVQPVYWGTTLGCFGYVKDLRIWSIVRPAPGADANLSLYGTEYDLAANWKMNEVIIQDTAELKSSTDPYNVLQMRGGVSLVMQGINSLKDYAGQNHATLTGNLAANYVFGQTSIITSELTSATQLVGQQYAMIPYNSSFDLNQTLSFEAWVKPDVGGTLRYLFIKNNITAGLTTGTYAFGLDASNKFFMIKQGTATITSTATVTPGSWTHLAATWNGTGTGGVTLYINGVQDSTGTIGSALTPNTDPVYIGYQFGSTAFTGLIGSMAMWNRALSATDVAAHYKAALIPLQKVFTALWSDPTGTLWDSMLQVALADLGMFTMTDTNTLRYESAYTLYNAQYPNHVTSQWNLNQSTNIVSGNQIVELLVNKVSVKVNPVTSPTTSTIDLWTSASNESLGASKLREPLSANQTTKLGYYSTLNAAGIREPIFPATGAVRIGQEIIKYTSCDDLYFYGLTRGAFNTPVSAHGYYDFIGECREYNMVWQTSPALLVKYPFITAQIFDKTVDVILWNSSPKQGHLVIALKQSFDSNNIYQLLNGTNPLTQLDDAFLVDGLGNSSSTSTGVVTQIDQSFADKIRRYGIKDIQIDNPFIQDSTYATQIAQFVLSHNNVQVPIIQVTTLGIPQLQLGDRVTVVNFNQLSITNTDYWVQNIGIVYSGGIVQTIDLREAF